LTDRESGVTRVSMVGARIGVWNERDLDIFASKRDRRRNAAGERQMNDGCIVIASLQHLQEARA